MYMVNAPVSRHLATAVAPYRQKYDPLAPFIPLHLGVLAPFEFSGPLKELSQHLEEVCDAHAPIKVAVIGWDAFEDKVYQLRFPVMTGRLEFTVLYAHLLTGPLSFIAATQGNTYEPEIIFGRFSSPEELAQAKKDLQGFEQHFVFRVAHLELWQRARAGEPWQFTQRFGLKATVAGRLRRPIPHD